jgi:hypothetical protein
MVYKYQEKTIEEIEKAAKNIEKITDDRFNIKIGTFRGYIDHGDGWIRRWKFHKGDLYVRINFSDRFKIKEKDDFGLDELGNVYINDEWNDKAKIDINENVFLKFNEVIDKVYKDNKERKAFYEKLNKELEALNKSFEDQKC